MNSWAQDPSALGGGWVNYKDYFWRKFMPRGGADAPLFCEGAWLGFNPLEVDAAPEFEGETPIAGWVDSMKRICIDRHSMKINVVFLDSSVRTVPLEDLWSLKWHRSWSGNIASPSNAWPGWLDR